MVLWLIVLLVLPLLVLLQVLPSCAEVVVLPVLPARALLRAGHLCLHVEVARESVSQSVVREEELWGMHAGQHRHRIGCVCNPSP